MFSNLKLRTLFIIILALLSTLVLTISIVNWNSAHNVQKDFGEVNSVAVVQAGNLRFAQIHSLRAMLRIYDVATMNNMAERKKELAIVKDFMSQSRERFALYEQAATQSEFGRIQHTKIQPQYQRYMHAVEQMLALAEDGDDGTRINVLRHEIVVPAVNAYSAVMDEFGTDSDIVLDAVAVHQEWMQSMSSILLFVFFILLIVLSGGAMLFLNRHVLQPLGEANHLFERIAAGDLTQRITLNSQNEIGQLFQSLGRMQEGLNSTVTSVRRSVDEISVGVGEIAAGNTDLSGRTESQAASLAETAASMEQLASTVKQNADNARQANQLATSASDVAKRGGEAVSEVVHTMTEISTSSHKISEIVAVIDGIAFQTNILALNAAVEAARAGEQGKGFAVVAGEVQSLAQKSAQAAKEIKTLIEDSSSRVETGTQQVERAGNTMREIVDSVQRVTDIMGEISAASQEQASGIDQVNYAVSQMDEVTQQNAALVEEASAAATSLQEQTRQLVQAVAVFKTQAGLSAKHVGPSLSAQPGVVTSATRKPDLKVRPAKKPRPMPSVAKPSAPAFTTGSKAGADADWESF